MFRPALALALSLAIVPPAAADPFIDAMETALEAYRDGDLQYAEDELARAQRLLAEMKAEGLAGFLPEAPEGWMREVDTEGGQFLGFMGGGTMAKAEYRGDGESFEISLMADNPMVAQLGMMLGNSAIISQMGGEVERINRVRFLREDRSFKGIVGNQILVQAEGTDPEIMRQLLEAMDFAGMERFGN